MAQTQKSARSAALWRRPDEVVLDHVALRASDSEWLAPARRLTLWSVKTPPGFLASLPRLEWLDLDGGSGTSVDSTDGCDGLRCLKINQIRGLHDVGSISRLTRLEFLSLYGQPQIRTVPSLAALTRLQRLEVGSLKGLNALAPMLDAPNLQELMLIRKISLASSDPDAIANHPTLARFYWFAEDVPDKVWVPVVERIGKPNTKALHTEEWFGDRF